MQLESSQPASSSRLRLVDILVDARRGSLYFGPLLSGVFVDPSVRCAAARRIASTVAGPRDADAGGTVEIDGRPTSVWSLPAALLPVGAPVLVDHEVVYGEWRAAWSRRRNEIAAAHAACRLEGYRIDAALEQARLRGPVAAAPANTYVVPTPPPVAPAPAPAPAAPASAPAPSGRVDWSKPPDASSRTRSRLQTLLAVLDNIRPRPLPEAQELADSFDNHALLVMARTAYDARMAQDPGPSIAELEHRVDAARIAVEQASHDVSDEARARIELAHRKVGEAEAKVFDAKRRKVPNARARHDQARIDELGVLNAAGFDSYASYLFEVTGGNGASGLANRLAAETELAAARAALDAAVNEPQLPTRLDLAERDVRMRARAAALLGRDPAPDPRAELRALVVEPVGRDDTIAEIGDVLRHGGVPYDDDPVIAARTYLDPSAVAPQPAPEPVAPAPTPAPVPAHEIADLEAQRAAVDRKLAEHETELAQVDRITAVEPGPLEGANLVIGLEATLAAYRMGALLGGRLPIVIDGVLDGLGADIREAALAVLVRAKNAQTVVVTGDPEVMNSLSREGGTLVRWPERIVDLVGEERSQYAPAPRSA